MQTKYKHIILSILLSIWTTVGWGQTPLILENWVLNQEQSGYSRNFVARDFIKLQDDGEGAGFSFKAEPGQSFSAKIDPGLLFPPYSNTFVFSDGTTSSGYSKTINSVTETGTKIVGSIPGQFNVSPGGGATYNVPIECPAGINGMQPNVALVYNSQGGNGIAGWGWNISGMSTISRTTKNYYYDGEKSGMIWDNTSPYALDGQRLIEIQRWLTGTVIDSIEYDTEAKSGNRIVAYNIQSWGPTCFKVYTKSGQTIQYGSDDDIASYFPIRKKTSTNYLYNLSWAIKSVLDNNGNSIQYSYKCDSYKWTIMDMTTYNSVVLDKISYGGNSVAGTTADQVIQFDYKQRTGHDYVDVFIDGKENINYLILDDIKVISNGVQLKKYSTVYNIYDNKSHLSSISIENDKGEHLNPLKFEWTSNNYTYTYQGNVTYETTPLITEFKKAGYTNDMWRNTKLFGDIDGDGDLDAVVQYQLEKKTYNGFWADLVNNDYSYNYKYVWAVYLNNNGNYKCIYDEEWTPTSGSDRTVRDNRFFIFLDKDNDGKDELYVDKISNDWTIYSIDPVTGKYGWGFLDDCGANKLVCYKYQEDKFTKFDDCSLNLLGSDYYHDANDKDIILLPGNFLGNGETQFLGVKNSSNTLIPFNISSGYRLSSDPTKSVPEQCSGCIVANKVTCSGNSNVLVSDFNGNGKSELVYVDGSTLKIYEFIKNSVTKNSILTCIYTDNNGINSKDKIYPCDFNGDGNTDFIVQKYSTKLWEFYVSTGSQISSLDMDNTLTKDAHIQILDVNKDGKSDILFFTYDTSGNQIFKLLISYGGGFVEKLSQPYSGKFMTYFNTVGRINDDKSDDILLLNILSYEDPIINISKGVNFDKISSFKDSYQNHTDVGYDIFNSNGIKVFENGVDMKDDASIRKFSASVYGSWDVVSQVVASSADSKTATTTQYDYGKAIIHKQGKGLLGYLSTTVKDLNSSIEKKSVSQLNDTYYFLYPTCDTTRISDTESYVSISAVDYYPVQATGGIYTMYPKSQTSNDVLGDLTSTVEYLTYDNYGNPTSVKTTKGDNVETKTVSYIRKGAWCDNKVKTETTVNVLNNERYTRTSDYEYDVKGNPTKQTVDPTDKNAVITEYKDFDSFGHAKTVEVSANGKTRSTKVTYKPSGRFIDSKTNALLETTNYDWDETHGLLNYEIDYRNNKTSYKYNNWGQTTEVQYPTGIRKAQVLFWAATGNTYGAKYYSYTQLSGKAPDVVWYDAVGHELVSETYGLDNKKKISRFTEYYADGKKKRVSEPTFSTTPQTWAAQYYYDDPYKRLSSVVSPMGTTSTVYSGKTTTVTSPEGTQSTTLNNSGQTLTSTVNGKSVTYTYYPSGLTKTSTPEGGQAITMVYDLQGKRTSLIDPDGGTVESEFNGFGDLLWERQKIHNNTDYITTTNNYDTDGLGLLQSIDRNGEVTSYTYDPTYKSRVNAIEIKDKYNTLKNKQVFSFDAFDRVTGIEETIGSRVYTTAKSYDALGRVKKETYPTGYYTVNNYDSNSNLTEVTDNANRSIWKPIDENAKGQLLHASKGGKTITYDFDERGLPTGITAAGVVKAAYSFNAKGNLDYRTDDLTKQREDFLYDNQNRLTNWDISKNGTALKRNSIAYDPTTSNISTKSDLGNFTMGYGGKRTDGTDIGPHALTSISGVPTCFPQAEPTYPTAQLSVTYTDFKKIATLTEKNKYYQLTYGVDDQRRMSVYKENGQTKLTRYYLGDYEEEVDAAGNTKKIHYLSDAILIQETDKPDKFYYSYADFQGSLIALTDQDGNLVERYAYDPWGARRNPDDWTQKDERTTWIVNRGYTGHEHLDAFGIINMNGRVYDPLTAMFFSPDPYVQAPENWLNYNRYGYCYGNPFRYTDPSGEWIHILIGAIIGGTLNWVSHGCQFNTNGLVAFGIGAAGGAIAAATFGAALATAGAATFGGALAGGYAGGLSYMTNTMVTSIGNAIYFHDPMPNGKQLLTGLATSVVTAGVINGITDPNFNFIGTRMTPIQLDPLPMPDPVGVTPGEGNVAGTVSDDVSNEIKAFNAAYQDASEIKLPEKLYHYTYDNPKDWGGALGRVTEENPNPTVHFTPNGELNRLNATMELDLSKVPRYRIEINTTDPNFKIENIQMMRNVQGNLFGHGGGGFEIIYKGPYESKGLYEFIYTEIK